MMTLKVLSLEDEQKVLFSQVILFSPLDIEIERAFVKLDLSKLDFLSVLKKNWDKGV